MASLTFTNDYKDPVAFKVFNYFFKHNYFLLEVFFLDKNYLLS